MDELDNAYHKILDSLDFEESLLDYSILDKHIEEMNHLSKFLNSSITIYDNFKKKHAYESPNHIELFGCSDYNNIQIHPEDYEHVIRNALICWRYFFVGNKNATNHKLIREYRININGVYKRVTEQIQVLELDPKGNFWLSLCIMDISPNQSPPYRVDSKLINIKTGDCITPVDSFYGKPLLSEREITILKLINSGLLSKEISDRLSISVHTVNTHRQRILEKLKVDTSIEAIKYASALGLLDD